MASATKRTAQQRSSVKTFIKAALNGVSPICREGIGTLTPSSPWLSGNPSDHRVIYDSRALITKIIQLCPQMPDVGDCAVQPKPVQLDNTGLGVLTLNTSDIPYGTLAVVPGGVIRDLCLGFLYEGVSSVPTSSAEFELSFLDGITQNLHTAAEDTGGSDVLLGNNAMGALAENMAYKPPVKLRAAPNIPLVATNATSFPIVGCAMFHTQDNRRADLPDFAAAVVESVRNNNAGAALVHTRQISILIRGTPNDRLNVLPVFVSDLAALLKFALFLREGLEATYKTIGLDKTQSLISTPIAADTAYEYTSVLEDHLTGNTGDVKAVADKALEVVSKFGSFFTGRK